MTGQGQGPITRGIKAEGGYGGSNGQPGGRGGVVITGDNGKIIYQREAERNPMDFYPIPDMSVTIKTNTADLSIRISLTPATLWNKVKLFFGQLKPPKIIVYIDGDSHQLQPAQIQKLGWFSRRVTYIMGAHVRPGVHSVQAYATTDSKLWPTRSMRVDEV